MTLRPLAAALAAGVLLLPCEAGAKKKGKADEAAAWTLPDDSPAPAAKELEKRFPDAPAVVVLHAVEHRWTEEMEQVTTLQRRLRLLDGVAGRPLTGLRLFLPEASGPWTPLDGRARVFAPDGSEKAEHATSVQAGDGGLIVEVSFPGARAGDLIDVVQRASSKRPAYPPLLVQEALPVLESRLLTIPPPVLTLRAYGSALPEGSLEPVGLEIGDAKAAGWRFRDLPALRTGPFTPPPQLVSGRLLLAIEKLPDLVSGEVIELDWPAWGRLSVKAARAWMEPAALEGLRATLGDSAEPAANLAALRERLDVRRTAAWPEHDSAAAALKAGSGNSADLALLLAAALGWPDAPGVELVAARPLERGPVAGVAPVHGNFTELLVRADATWLDPAPGGGAGECPPRLRGTEAATLKAGLTGPEPLPGRRAEDNRVERRARLALSPEGRLSGTVAVERSPVAARLGTGGPVPEDGVLDRADWAEREGGSMSYGVLPWRLFQDVDLSGEPPAGLLDLGWPRLVVDEIAVELPPGVTGAKLSAPATIDAGPAGRYERTVKPEGRTVTVTRTFRLDATRFGPEESGRLFEWLRRVQEAERAETVLKLE